MKRYERKELAKHKKTKSSEKKVENPK